MTARATVSQKGEAMSDIDQRIRKCLGESSAIHDGGGFKQLIDTRHGRAMSYVCHANGELSATCTIRLAGINPSTWKCVIGACISAGGKGGGRFDMNEEPRGVSCSVQEAVDTRTLCAQIRRLSKRAMKTLLATIDPCFGSKPKTARAKRRPPHPDTGLV